MTVHAIEDARTLAARALLLRDYATLLGLPPIERIVQRGRDPLLARYTIEFGDGRNVRIGNVDILFSQAKLARALSVTLSHHPPPIPRDTWADLTRQLVNIGVEVEEIEGEGFEHTVREWLGPYAAHAAKDRRGAIVRREPFIEDGDLHVSATPFAVFVRRNYSEQVKLPELRQALTDLGFERVAVNYTPAADAARTTASYYRAPLDVLDPGGVF